jgi:hypothetical protein
MKKQRDKLQLMQQGGRWQRARERITEQAIASKNLTWLVPNAASPKLVGWGNEAQTRNNWLIWATIAPLGP